MHLTSHGLAIMGLGTSSVQKLQFPSLATHCCGHQITVLLLRRDILSQKMVLVFIIYVSFQIRCVRFQVSDDINGPPVNGLGNQVRIYWDNDELLEFCHDDWH